MTCKNASIQVQIQSPNGDLTKKVFFLLCLLLSGLTVSAQSPKQRWTDSVFRTLSTQEKIGQVFLVKLNSAYDKNEIGEISDRIKDWKIGGVWIGHGGPKSTAMLVNQLQQISKVPLLTGITAAGGLGESIDSTLTFISPMALGSLSDESIPFRLGNAIASKMKLLGLNLDFAPNTSSWKKESNWSSYYSSGQKRLTRISFGLVSGLQSGGVIVCASPTEKIITKLPDGRDSLSLYSANRIDSTTTVLIKSGIDAINVDQFHFAVTENRKLVRANASSAFINDVLKNEMAFRGLVFRSVPQTIVRIKGEKKIKKGEYEYQALLAGNHMLINSQNIGATIKLIMKTLKKNPDFMTKLDAAVKNILDAKFDAGLASYKKTDTENLLLKLNTPDDQLFQHEMAEASITVIRNSFSFLPVRQLEDRKFVCLSVGRSVQNEFGHYLNKYVGFEKESVVDLKDTVGLVAKLRRFDVVVVGIYPQAYLWQDHLLPILQGLSSKKNIVLCFFGNPEGIKKFPGFPSVIAAYSDDDLTQKIAPQIIFGGLASKGELPVTIDPALHEGLSIKTPSAGRLSYSVPEAAGMDSKTLQQIVRIANEAIEMKATPGCEVLVVRKGKVIYENPIGYLTYDNKAPVTDETLYDLASVTKVSATLQAVMFMYEKGLIDVNKKASVYLPELRKSNKKDFTLVDILTHQAGLWPFLPFWAQTVKDTLKLPEYYSRKASPEYPYPVASNMYSSRGMKDSLYRWIVNAKVVDKAGRTPYDYRYSDMGFFMMLHLAEKMLNQPMDQFLDQNLYEILGASTTGYLPLSKFPPSRIAPTENDKLFRRSQLTGYVHDQLAAMNGGIAGHAGLFSTANDLAKLGQMWLQKGTYAGHRYFKPETIDYFTRKQFDNSRRGLGWDKPTVSDPNGPTSAYASALTFGHTGFTGISIWVDPQFDLVFIFFSNRVYPEMTNNKIINANIRPRIQDVVYRSIFNYCSNH